MIIGISGKIGSGKDTIARIVNALLDQQALKNNADYGYPLEVGDTFDITYPWENRKHFEVKKFASKLKEIVALLIGCSLEQLEDQEFKNTPLGPEWDKYQILDFMKPKPVFFTDEDDATRFCHSKNNSQHAYTHKKISITPRWLLQQLGTEFGREIVHPNIWVNALFSEYKSLGSGVTYAEDYEVSGKTKLYNKGFPNWIITDVRFPNEAKAIKDRGGILIRVTRNFNDVKQAFNDHPSETSLDDYKEFDHLIYNNSTIEALVQSVKLILQHSNLIK